MELRHLRSFVVVAEEGNITRAAQRLHISQPPLTRQIQQLEAELDTALFERTSRGVELTDAGRVLLEDARQVLRDVEHAVVVRVAEGVDAVGARLLVGTFDLVGSVGADRVAAKGGRIPSRSPNSSAKGSSGVLAHLAVGQGGESTEVEDRTAIVTGGVFGEAAVRDDG